MPVTLFKDLVRAALPLTGTERLPTFQTGQPDDVYVTPFDIANVPVQSRQEPSTAITPLLTDAFKIVETTATSSVVVTIPHDVTVPFYDGSLLGFQQFGTGRVSYVAAFGVTVAWPKAADGVTDCRLSRCINAPVTFRKRGTGLWVAEGDLTAT